MKFGNRKVAKGRPTVGHTGGSVGGTAVLAILPGQKLAVSMLVNSDQPFVHHAQRIVEVSIEE